MYLQRREKFDIIMTVAKRAGKKAAARKKFKKT